MLKPFTAALLLAIACTRVPLRPPPLFLCQHSCTPEKPTGPAAITITTSIDLLQLTHDTPYKYVVTEEGRLIAAGLPVSAPNNPFHHPVLAVGKPIRTGGQLTVRHNNQRVLQIFVSQETYSYCATIESLAAAEVALGRAGVARPLVMRLDRSPGCVPKMQVPVGKP